MWRSGVSLVTWFTLVDSPFPDSPYQSGLYFVNGKPKPALEAFRFPFVALKAGTSMRLWGRTPGSKPGRVVVERQGSGWRRIADGSHGPLRHLQREEALRRRRLPGALCGRADARFSTTEPPDHFYRPFGTPH